MKRTTTLFYKKIFIPFFFITNDTKWLCEERVGNC